MKRAGHVLNHQYNLGAAAPADTCAHSNGPCWHHHGAQEHMDDASRCMSNHAIKPAASVLSLVASTAVAGSKLAHYNCMFGRGAKRGATLCACARRATGRLAGGNHLKPTTSSTDRYGGGNRLTGECDGASYLYMSIDY